MAMLSANLSAGAEGGARQPERARRDLAWRRAGAAHQMTTHAVVLYQSAIDGYQKRSGA